MEFSSSAAFARICGELTGDGHIQTSGGRRLVSFYSKNIETITDFERRFFFLFDIHGKVYKDTRRWKSYKLFFCSKYAVEVLIVSEVPAGNKTNRKFSVPRWVLSGNSQIRASYLRGLFDSEGAVTYTKPQDRWRIEIEMYKSEATNNKTAFMEGIKALLESLDIPCSPVRTGRRNVRKDGTTSIAIKLEVKPLGFTNFYKKISFSDKVKAARLRNAILAVERKAQCPLPLRRYSACAELQSQAAQGDSLQ